MNFTPLPAQVKGIKRLKRHKEALLFAGCGLGTTAMSLDVIHHLFLEGAIKGALIVAPLRVANMTWPNEVAKWDKFSWMKVANLRTTKGMKALRNQDADLYVINYEKLPWFRKNYLDKHKNYPFNLVVWDELTMAKNWSSKRVNAVRSIFRRCMDYHWGLTGTPNPNGYMDLFAQSRLIDGGKALLDTITQFRYRFCKCNPFSYHNQWEVTESGKRAIENRLKGYALTLKTEDWLDLPEIEEEDVTVTLPKKNRKEYNTLEYELFVKLQEGDVDAVNRGALITKLIQMAGGAVYTEEGDWAVIHDKKLKALSNLQRRGNSLVVYNYKHELERLCSLENMTVFSDYREEEICSLWNQGKVENLAVHPRMVSHGLNLQAGGSNVIWLSPTYNREHYEQLYRRLARHGQTERVKVYRIVAKDTIDEVVLEVLTDKGNTQEALLTALKTYAKNHE